MATKIEDRKRQKNEASRRWKRRNAEKSRAAVKAWRAANKERNAQYMAAYARRRFCSFPPELVEACRQLQGGLCAICRRRMQVEIGRRQRFDGECADHDHCTNLPRGLLCSTCNKGLGAYEKHQKPMGLEIKCYDDYLARPPVASLGDRFGQLADCAGSDQASGSAGG